MGKKFLLIQMIPLAAFLLADMLISDPIWAVVVALVCVFATALYQYTQEKKLDKFLLFDILLIGTFGAASILTKDEVFFKLKPAVLDLVMVPLLGFLYFSKDTVLVSYVGRFNPNATLNDDALKVMRRMISVMAIFTVLHSASVTFAAYNLSKEKWALVSGPGFYLVTIPLLVLTLIERKKTINRIKRAQEDKSYQSPVSEKINHQKN